MKTGNPASDESFCLAAEKDVNQRLIDYLLPLKAPESEFIEIAPGRPGHVELVKDFDHIAVPVVFTLGGSVLLEHTSLAAI